MAKQAINIVWLKRDLRTQDHAPLQAAEQNGLPYLILYLFEPSLLAHPDTSLRHLQFQYHSLQQVNQTLQAYQKQVTLCYAEAAKVFDALNQYFDIRTVFSYQESGIDLSYTRDKQLKQYFKKHGISWQQFQRDGILRGIKNREGWIKAWHRFMHAPLIHNTFTSGPSPEWENPFPIPTELIQNWTDYPDTFQPAGESFARKYLHSFSAERARNYSKHISKPAQSRTSCSRLSPYLAWGNLSIRQVYQATEAAKKTSGFKTAINNFQTRLRWHCHFIQKFEVECRYESECINRGYELLEHPENETYIQAWKTGQTGFPLVDACMRCLQQTGWINFRMRAMLVSFFCHHLYQDWRLGVYHLAQLFLDYEPGIHYPQFQMQAGTTGINTIRMYNPVKQSQDHDPEGIFIKKWLPELSPVPLVFIHEPHKMSQIEQELYGVKIGVDYPAPLIDLEQSGREARDKIWAHRKHEAVQKENLRILITHTHPRISEVRISGE